MYVYRGGGLYVYRGVGSTYTGGSVRIQGECMYTRGVCTLYAQRAYDLGATFILFFSAIKLHNDILLL